MELCNEILTRVNIIAIVAIRIPDQFSKYVISISLNRNQKENVLCVT